MSKDLLAEKLKELRQRRGFSQEELADKTGLSIRSIQRIESGQTQPRGDSIVRLSNALGVSPDDILDWQVIEDKNVISVLHLSQLSFVAFPLLGIILPLIIWILNKNTVKHVDAMGKKILNFQITWAIVFFLFTMSKAFSSLLGINFYIPSQLFLLSIAFLYSYNLGFIIFNFLRSRKSKAPLFVPALKFLS